MKFVLILSFVHLISFWQLGHRVIDEQLWRKVVPHTFRVIVSFDACHGSLKSWIRALNHLEQESNP